MRLAWHGQTMIHDSRPDQAANSLTKNAMVRSSVSRKAHKDEVAVLPSADMGTASFLQNCDFDDSEVAEG